MGGTGSGMLPLPMTGCGISSVEPLVYTRSASDPCLFCLILTCMFSSFSCFITLYFFQFMFTVVEPLAVLGVAYLSYLSAELFHFSGIIRYVLYNIQISLSR